MMKNKRGILKAALVLVFLAAIAAGAAAQSRTQVEGTWQYFLLDSPWGQWKFEGNKYSEWMLDWEEEGKPKDPDEIGTFEVKGGDLILKPTTIWGLDVSKTSKPKTMHFELKGTDLRLWEEGKKGSVYKKK